MMAWIKEERGMVWDVSYFSWSKAVTRSQELGQQYSCFTEVVHAEEEGIFEVITRQDLNVEHSVICRCEECTA